MAETVADVLSDITLKQVQSVRAEAVDRGRTLTQEERQEALQDRFLRNADLGRLGAGVTALFAGQDVDAALNAANTALDHNFVGALPHLIARGIALWDKLDEEEQEAARETFQEIMEELWEHPYYYMSQVGECLPGGYGAPFAVGNKGYDVATGESTFWGATGELTFETVMGVIGGKAVKGAGKLTRFVASKLKTKLAEKRMAKTAMQDVASKIDKKISGKAQNLNRLSNEKMGKKGEIRTNGQVQDAHEHTYNYHKRIRSRALQDPVGHNFPYSFDDVILKTKPIIQTDGSLIFKISGELNGKKGVFEIALNPETSTIFHRVFRSQ